MKNFSLVIPTYKRPHEVKETIELYTANFKQYGWNIPVYVFDESPAGIAKCVIANLKQINADFPIFYIGEKERIGLANNLIAKESKLDSELLEDIFLGSKKYGNRNSHRNSALAYLIGESFLTVDDDMKPWGLMHKEDVQLSKDQISKGMFLPEGIAKTVSMKQQYDIVTGYLEFLGKKVCNFPAPIKGIIPYEVEANTAHALHEAIMGHYIDDDIFLANAKINPEATLRYVMTHLTGDADIDSEDILMNFIESGEKSLLDGKEVFKYVMMSCKPAIMHTNWRFTAAMTAFDNTSGLPPFIPTAWRCGDFGIRVFLAKTKHIAMAYTGNATVHDRSLSGRNDTVADFAKEELAILLKSKIKSSVNGVDDFTFNLASDVSVTKEESQNIFDKAHDYIKSAKNNIKKNPLKADNYKYFITLMQENYPNLYNFARFHTYIQKEIDREYRRYRRTLEVWPRLMEVVTDLKKKSKLPVLKIN